MRITKLVAIGVIVLSALVSETHAGASNLPTDCVPQPSTRTSADDPGTVGAWNCFGKERTSQTAVNASQPFCDVVNYRVACDMNDPNSCNDTFAQQVFTTFNNSLSVYSCEEYSRLWTCNDCATSYKRWLCAVLFQRCLTDDADPCNGTCLTQTNLDAGRAVPTCVRKTCQDVCYDVVRKCPIHIGFTCPPVQDTREYDAQMPCNYVDMVPPSAAIRATASLVLLLGSILTYLMMTM